MLTVQFCENWPQGGKILNAFMFPLLNFIQKPFGTEKKKKKKLFECINNVDLNLNNCKTTKCISITANICCNQCFHYLLVQYMLVIQGLKKERKKENLVN